MSTQSVFVVGGRGFVGSHVVRRFAKAGYKIHVFGPAMADTDDRLADLEDSITTIDGSVEDSAHLSGALHASQAQLVLSFAAYGEGRQGLLRSGEANSERTFAINVMGFRNILQAAQQAGVERVLWSSSTVVYGPPEDYDKNYVDESDPCRPRSVYGLSKTLAERIADYYRDAHQLEVCALRLPLVFGPGLWYQGAAAALLELIANAKAGHNYTVSAPKESFDLMYVTDVADAFLHTANHPKPLNSLYNIKGFTTSYPEIIATLSQLVPDYQITFNQQAAPFSFALLDQQRFQREIGLQAQYNLQDALAACL